MTKKRIFTGTLLAVATAIAGLATACSSGGSAQQPSSTETINSIHTGSVGLALTLSNGAKLSAVNFSVSGAALAQPVTGVIPTESDLATVSAFIGQLPPGDYEIVLTGAADDGQTNCEGKANFSIEAAKTTSVTVNLICSGPNLKGDGVINSTINACPVLTSVVVAPLQNEVGFNTNVSATASDTDMGDTLTFSWAAQSGAFSDPNVANTIYKCQTGGTDNLTVTVNDGKGCTSTETIEVICKTTAVCGNGVRELGEPCDGSDTPMGETCSTECKLIKCGDGRVDGPAVGGTEECDGIDTAACVQCKNRPVVCGDGYLTPPELCEGLNTATCLNCAPRPQQCGDGFVTGTETCDPQDAATGANCDPATCQPKADPCVTCTNTKCDSFVANCSAFDPGCTAMFNCIKNSGCNKNSPLGGAQECYCGTAEINTCLDAFDSNVPNGPCKTLVEQSAAVANNFPFLIAQVLYNSSSNHGSAMSLARCQIDFCDRECGLCTLPGTNTPKPQGQCFADF